jgi:hypothetical protein
MILLATALGSGSRNVNLTWRQLDVDAGRLQGMVRQGR